jgi:hypothetical protein
MEEANGLRRYVQQSAGYKDNLESELPKELDRLRRITMFKRNLLLKIGSLMIAGSVLAVSPSIMYAHHPEKDSAPIPFSQLPAATTIARPPAGMGSIVWTNYNGGSFELDVDLGGMRFMVPPEANNAPSRVEINLAPGTYTYTASVAGMNDITRSVDVEAGKVIGLSFYSGSPDLVVHNVNRSHADVGEHTYVTHDDYDQLLVAQGDMTAQVGR